MRRGSFVLAILLVSLIVAQSKLEIKLGVTAGIGESIRNLFVQIYKEAGALLIIKELPTARIMNEFDTGTIDAVLFASEYAVKNRANALLLGLEKGKPLFSFNLHGFVLASRMSEFTGKQTYNNCSIGYIIGNSAHENAILELGAKPVPVIDYGNALNMLVTGRIDMIFAVPMALNDYYASVMVDKSLIAMLPEPLARFNYYHILNKKYSNLALSVQKLLEKNSDVIKKLLGAF